MKVDSFRFLPRSFRAMYENPPLLPDEDQPLWAEFGSRLADASITLLTSAGLHVTGSQQPFDAERERREATWGDPTWRRIPTSARTGDLGMTHLHVRNDDPLVDQNVVLPLQLLAELADEGVIGGPTDGHVSVMGFQEEGLHAWRTTTADEVVAMLRDERCDGIVLAPV